MRCATYSPPKCSGQGADWKTDISAPSSNVLSDIQDNSLASVSWVTPSKQDSDHPKDHSDTGPSWVSSVVNAIGSSSYWNQTAIIVVWDDWGGFYDNAAPPQLDYRGLGIRTPCLIISPYAKSGYVDHTQYEYGSILRFIEEVYGLPAGSIGPTDEGYTDARAHDLDNAFNFTQKPRRFVPIATPYSASYFRHEPPSDEPGRHPVAPRRTRNDVTPSSEIFHKKYYCHRAADENNDRAREWLRKSAKEPRTEIAAEQSDDRHRQRVAPINDPRDDERNERDAVDREREHVFDRVLRVEARQAGKCEDRKHQNPHPCAEIAPVNRDGELHGESAIAA